MGLDMQKLLKVAVFALSALVLAGCQQGRDAYALTTTNTLIRFDTNNANNITAESTITGLTSGETLLQIAFRPANKQLYGITSSNFLVTVNTDTGVTTRVGSTAFSSLSLTVPVIDFNPVGDYLRVINFEGANSANNTNFRVDPTTGAQLQTDGSGTLSFVSNDTHEGEIPRLAAIAYSNSVDDATSTTLYAIDVTTQTLESATTAGVLTTIGAANNGFTANAGIDIVPNNDKAYAAIADRNGSARFYQLNLSDGTTSSGDNIGSSRQIRSLAVTLDEPKRKGFNF
jgi:hypothetical protein